MKFPMGGPLFRPIQNRFFTAVSLVLITSTLGSLSLRAQSANKPLVQAYSQADIGRDSAIWTTRQGADGMLYFGSDLLMTFDGSLWRNFPINGAYALRAIDLRQDGGLWAGANDEIGWYSKESSGQFIYHSLVANLPAEHSSVGPVWRVFAEPNGALYVSAEKVYRWNGAKFQVWSMPTPRHLEAVRSGDDIYVYHAPTGLHLMTAEGPRLVIPESILGKSTVMWLEKTQKGYLLVTTMGLFNYTDGQLIPYASAASNYIRPNMLACATKLPDGRIVMGTLHGGIVVLSADGNSIQTLTEQDGLPSNSVFSLFLDRENELWATSEFAIFHLSLNSTSTIFGQKPGVKAQPIIRLARDRDKLIVGYYNKIYEFNPSNGDFIPFESTVTNVMDMETTPHGVFAATYGGVLKISEGKISPFLPAGHSASATKISRRWPDQLLVADAQSILLVDPAGHSRTLVKNLPDAIGCIAEDAQGRLWLGSNAHGVWVATPNESEPVEAIQAGSSFGLPDLSGAATVSARSDGSIIVFSLSGGRFLSRTSNVFSPIENCPRFTINSVPHVAADDTLWMVYPAKENQSAGVARVAVEGDRAIWQPHSVDGLWNIGMPESIFAETKPGAETILWIGGTTGLLRNVVPNGPLAPIPRPPVVRALVRTKDNDKLESVTPTLPYSTRGLIFEFAAPEFARRPALHLETMLDGIDQEWKPADASARRELTALRDGRYTFRVRAIAETGVVSPSTITQFEILPPWWRTGPAFLGAFLALVPAGYSFYRWRVRLLRQRNVELEHKVLERTMQLEKASAAKTQFVANMSHDIRNPLNGIVGLALALEDTWLDVKQRELVATLRECTSYLSTLVDDVLDFSSIEAGQVELRPSPFSPAELLRSIAVMFKMEAISSGATLQVDADPKLPAAYVGDAGRIQQVLVNFVSNALKYSGGPIKLTVTIPEDAPEEIEFSVTDQGPGISEEGQRVLFTKFSRLTSAQSREITGTGLGLASCRLLAGLMCGSVGVRSSLGHGARFYLRLPLDIFPMPAVTDTTAAPMATPILPNCNVLLVEDTNYNAMAAAAVLAKFGLACERVSTGAEALKIFAEKRHNLVLLDRNLPDMDGTEVARRIRALESDGPRTIILAVTAYCTLEDRALCLNAGMDAFVGKPLTPQKLRRVLTAAGRRHLAAATMHVSPDVSATGIDVSLLEYISDGTGQGLSRQIELFLTALGEAEKQLEQAVRTSDFKLLGDAAHGVLSHARLVGSASLSTAAAGLQNAANARDREAFGSLLQRVRREIESLTAVVRRHPGAERTA